jgi:thiamine-phosphate pyrophosphorylase|tara:strand:- start:607 stop:1185 length:579 start_codon:yes stop_codon:yes gene_type:complete
MHNYLPNLFIFLDKYNNEVFKYNNINAGIIYRNYKDPKRKTDLDKIAKECKKKRFKLFISNDVKLALKVKAHGVYIPSFNKTKRLLNFEKKGFIILGSAHSQREIQSKISQKCEAIFLSPIFPILKAKKHLGIHKFNLLSRNNKIDILALGGINECNYSKLKMTKIAGFGGISLFKKKPALKKAGFLKIKFF